MDWLNQEVMTVVGSVVGAAILWIWRKVRKDKADKHEELLKWGASVAYGIVNDVAKRTDTKIDDKAAMGLQALSQFLEANGEKLVPADEKKALMLFQALHGQEAKK